jgi:hypothetical protein
LAALWVFAYHYGFSEQFRREFPWLVGSFLRRRSLRIYPPYWLSFIVVAATPFVIEGVSALKTGTFVRPSSAGNINLGFLD